jgi:hypothetical protein
MSIVAGRPIWFTGGIVEMSMQYLGEGNRSAHNTFCNTSEIHLPWLIWLLLCRIKLCGGGI